LGLFTSYARIISMENAIQLCRENDLERTPYAVQPGRPDWNHAFPPTTQEFRDVVGQIKIPPTQARPMYEAHPVQPVCPIGAGGMFTFIRHDGKTQMCACVADRRITLTDYLKATPDGLVEERQGHAICQQCIKYRLNLYFHIVDRAQWGTT
jgi:hypothetical protein